MAVELATAYVQLVPSARGMQAAIASEMGGPAAAAGGQAGGLFAGGFQKAATVGAVAGAAAIGKGLFDFVGFERQMNEVFTLIPDAGQEMFDDLTAQTKNFAKEFGVLPQDVVKPLYDSLSAGVPADNVFAFLETANEFSKAGAVDLATSVDALTTGVNAFGLGAEGAGRISDSLFTAVKLGKTTVDELASSLFQVAPIAASFGVSVEDVSAGFATLTAQGTPTKVAATQMKAAISELGKQGTKASKAFEELTGKSFTEFISEGGTLVDVAGIMSGWPQTSTSPTRTSQPSGTARAPRRRRSTRWRRASPRCSTSSRRSSLWRSSTSALRSPQRWRSSATVCCSS
jgi:hypothetical protein